MDRQKASEIFQAYGSPQIKTGSTIISFSRQTEKDLEEIENKTDDELVQHWKSLVFMNEILGNVSLNEMQRISLIELEFNERTNIKTSDLQSWFDEHYKKEYEQDLQ